MKKILISILIIALVILAYFAIFEGLELGGLEVLSVQQIVDANDELTNDIETTNALLKKDYPSAEAEVQTEIAELLNKKEAYYRLARISTDGEITKANTEETYLPEYLWVKVGNHAKSRGVNIKMDVNTGDTGEADMKNIAFTVTGKYVGVIQFVSELENDAKLNFKIENFKMVKTSEDLTATFNVRNIRIKTETAAQPEETTPMDETAQQEPAQDMRRYNAN